MNIIVTFLWRRNPSPRTLGLFYSSSECYCTRVCVEDSGKISTKIRLVRILKNIGQTDILSFPSLLLHHLRCHRCKCPYLRPSPRYPDSNKLLTHSSQQSTTLISSHLFPLPPSLLKVSMSSSSTFSSTSSSNFSSSNVDSSFDDMAKDMQDRLVFSHDNVNLKLPSGGSK